MRSQTLTSKNEGNTIDDLKIHVKKVIRCLEKGLEKAYEESCRAKDGYDQGYLDGVEIGISWALHLLKDIIPCPYDIEQEEDETRP
jgi:hypothetical protein